MQNSAVLYLQKGAGDQDFLAIRCGLGMDSYIVGRHTDMGYARCNIFGCECLGLTTMVDLKQAHGQGSEGRPRVARQCVPPVPPSSSAAIKAKPHLGEEAFWDANQASPWHTERRLSTSTSRREQARASMCRHEQHAQVFAAISQHCARNWHRWAWGVSGRAGRAGRAAGSRPNRCCLLLAPGCWWALGLLVRRLSAPSWPAILGCQWWPSGGRKWDSSLCWAQLGKHRRLKRRANCE
ncbi:hypothetical protein B0T25DRAFT_77218 [Lasiosphaeria hispida]|uniref:Uncharacterized protein n=1 Tax=Lasiosphaeria hispida TaxID=260671 RepID=A0AAJ0HPJ8_9PEZI|nr:hypothetical protein B0T25DRAFT_77218 [Lasiosphaeria hispida]